jgi:predicted porin
MNKKMIALAVAGVMAAPIASAAPSVYGRVQAELADAEWTVDGNAALSDEGRNLVDNAMGRVGIKGSEDLGNGLSALYKYEFKTNTVTSGGLSDRATYVGLKGAFGTVTFGRNAGAYKGTNLDPYIATTLEARNGGGQSSGNFGHAGFINDTIKYTNKFGAVKFSAIISADDSDTTSGDNQFALDYKGGPLRLIAAVSNNDFDTDDEESRTKFAAQYKMGPWKFTAQAESIDKYRVDLSEYTGDPADDYSGAASGIDTDMTMFMVDYKMGKNTITAKVAQEDYDGGEVDVTMVALKHSFSKKTRVFVGTQMYDWDGGDASVVTVGMRTDF